MLDLYAYQGHKEDGWTTPLKDLVPDQPKIWENIQINQFLNLILCFRYAGTFVGKKKRKIISTHILSC